MGRAGTPEGSVGMGTVNPAPKVGRGLRTAPDSAGSRVPALPDCGSWNRNLDEYLAGTDPIVSVPPEFGPCELLPDGRRQLTLLGQVGRRYAVQVSTDLVQWETWTNIVSTSTATLIEDAPQPGRSARFYRVVER